MPQCSRFAKVFIFPKFELCHHDRAVLEVSFCTVIGNEAIAKQSKRTANYILMLTAQRISEERCKYIFLLRDVFQAIDEIVRVFAFLTVIVSNRF